MNRDAPSMDGCLRKLHRAEQHLSDLRTSVEDFLAADPYGVRACFYADRDLSRQLGPTLPFDTLAYLALHFQELGRIPTGLSTQIGDCVRNLRSSLDHLVWALAGDAANSSTHFPVAIHERDFDQARTLEGIRGLGDHAFALVRALQPYQRPEQARRCHPLWILHELDRIDRHRSFRLGASLPFDPWTDVVEIRYGTMGPPEVIRRGALAHDEAFVRLLVRSSPARHVVQRPCPGYVTPELHIVSPYRVVFGDAGPATNRPVVATLEDLLAHVSDRVLPGFRQFF